MSRTGLEAAGNFLELAAPSGKEAYSSQPELQNGRKSVIPGLPITDALRSHIVQHLYSFFLCLKVKLLQIVSYD